MKKHTVGWDIGGAHVKAAVLNAQAEVLSIRQVACPLWKGIEQLHNAVAVILSGLPAGSYLHVVTMTGELADCFTSRSEGVKAIIQTMQQLLPSRRLLIYASHFGFLKPEQVAARHEMAIASVNWLASARLVAGQCESGLFVDIGSTTTDIIRVENQRVTAIGYTDYQRLVSGELLYTGVVRTAVMVIAQQADFNGQTMGLMAEYFATMADVYRLTGDLADGHDLAETADGAEKTPLASARRLSRLTGYEFDVNDWPLWLAFAGYLKDQQKQRIRLACVQQLNRFSADNRPVLIGAGIGRFLLKEIAEELGGNYMDFNGFFKHQASVSILDAGDCAPAVAVAYLGGGFG